MTIELKMLALSVALGMVQIVMASHAASVQRGYRWAAGHGDEVPLPGTIRYPPTSASAAARLFAVWKC